MNIYTTKEQVENEILQTVKDSGVFKKMVFTPLSKIYTIIRAIANAVYLFIDKDLIRLQKSIHPHTAEEADLYDWLNRYGLTWKKAKPANHKIRIGSTKQPTIDIDILQGQAVTTAANHIEFTITASVKLLASTSLDTRGFYTVEALVECSKNGNIGNVAQDAITEIDSPPSGIDLVYNPDVEPFEYGKEKESIASIRSRIKQSETGSTQMWTPDWFKSQALNHAEVFRVIFVSAKELNIPGLSKILVSGKTNAVSKGILDDLNTEYNNTPEDNSGSGLILVEKVPRVDINKVITIKFSEAAQIQSQKALDLIYENYFLSLLKGQSFSDNQLTSLYFQFAGVIEVVIVDPGDIVVPAQSLACIGATFQVIGEVYV